MSAEVFLPDKNGEKGYVLLREAIASSGQAGIATVVIRARQHLAALMAVGDALVLELLRYSQELRDLDEFDFPTSDLCEAKVSKKEVELATAAKTGCSSSTTAKQPGQATMTRSSTIYSICPIAKDLI